MSLKRIILSNCNQDQDQYKLLLREIGCAKWQSYFWNLIIVSAIGWLGWVDTWHILDGKFKSLTDEEPLAQPETQLQSVQRVNMQFRIFLDLIIKTLPQQSHMINLNILKQPMWSIVALLTSAVKTGGKIENVFCCEKGWRNKICFQATNSKTFSVSGQLQRRGTRKGSENKMSGQQLTRQKQSGGGWEHTFNMTKTLQFRILITVKFLGKSA